MRHWAVLCAWWDDGAVDIVHISVWEEDRWREVLATVHQISTIIILFWLDPAESSVCDRPLWRIFITTLRSELWLQSILDNHITIVQTITLLQPLSWIRELGVNKFINFLRDILSSYSREGEAGLESIMIYQESNKASRQVKQSQPLGGGICWCYDKNKEIGGQISCQGINVGRWEGAGQTGSQELLLLVVENVIVRW